MPSESPAGFDYLRQQRSGRLGKTVGLLLVLTVFAGLYVVPIGRLLLLSLFSDDQGALSWSLSFASYVKILTSSHYLGVIFTTLRLSLIVTLLCLVLGYPVAYLMATSRASYLHLCIILILLPLWTSILVRTYAWVVILQRKGLLNESLLAAGIIDTPLSIAFTETAVIIGSVHILLPFMILPIFNVLKKIDGDLLRAATGLGASGNRAFWNVTLPLSLTGIATGTLIVFIMALGFFVTPAILGGGKVIMIAMSIQQQVTSLLNWQTAATLTAILLIITLVFLMLFQRFVGLDRLVK